MKKINLLISGLILMTCHVTLGQTTSEQKAISILLDKWHQAAAQADYKNYFKPMSEHAVFIGTDATEHWTKADFMTWAKPYFDKGKAWNFTPMQRHIYFGPSDKIAWFDELLDTQMKICRGSGVLIKDGSDWKIEQYVLSMTIPNEKSDSVVTIKAPIEDALIKNYQIK